jgi:hypothetical protein
MEMPSKPKMTPELFKKLLEQVRPVKIHGFIPQEPGVRQEHKDDKPVVEPSEFMPHDLNDVPMKWFSLAPLYSTLGSNFNLLADFVNTQDGKDAKIASFKVEFPLMPSLDSWSNVVEGIDAEHWEALRIFLAQSGFTRQDKWWLITENEFSIRQPKYNNLFSFTVYTPVSAGVGIYAYLDVSTGAIAFYPGAGNPLVEKYAAIYNISVKKGP